MSNTQRGFALGIAVIAGLLAGCSTAAKASEFTITGTEYKYETSGSAVPGSNLITFKNDGKEPHHVQLLQIAPGSTMQDVAAALQAGDLSKVPGKFEGGVGQLAPGASGQLEAALTGGTYAMLCFVPSADGAPHFVKGMANTFEVTGEPDATVFEAPDVKVVGLDYSFEAPATVKAGETSIELTNNGKEPHEANLLKLNEGVTLQQAVQGLMAAEATPGGPPPPVTLAGGAQGILPGQKTVVVADLSKGEYALVCFITDATNTPHIAKGMVRSLKVE